MKMNRFFLLTLAIAGMFISCSNDEAIESTNEGQEISFRLQGSMPTGIQRTTASTTVNVDAFVVYGTDDYFAGKSSPEMIFDGVTVARQIGPGNFFTYAPKKYYGESATKAYFIAFSPVSTKVSNITSTISGTVPDFTLAFEYTVPAPDNSGKGYTTQEDLLIARTPVNSLSTTTVHMNFSHALSRVFVTASNSTETPVVISALILKNLVTKGTLVCDPLNATPAKWTPSSTKGDYGYILSESVAITSSLKKYVTSMEQGMMVIPQETVNTNDDNSFDTGDFALEVQYSFAGQNMVKNILLNDGYTFLANKQYSINIEFTGTAIDFTVDVTDFEEPINGTNP